MLLLFTLIGCEYLPDPNDVQDTLDGLTNPLVVQGIVLGVAEPESDQIDLSGTDFAQGTAVTIFAADAASVSEIENAPVTGADASFKIGQQAAVTLEAGAAPGAYKAVGDGLEYVAGALGELSFAVGDGASGAQVTLPPAVDVLLPPQHDGSDLTVDLSEQSYDQVLVVVFDLSTQEITYSNEPKDIAELYEYSTAEGAGDSVVIPGAEAFPGESIYAVGIAGMVKGDSSSFSSMNTALSSLQAGQLVFQPVSTMPFEN
ncbi:MAG: hypothetical protein VX899_16755 [Myxococcota bacterium]|nr:hypothetical protein [Myxococcota bacterium]